MSSSEDKAKRARRRADHRRKNQRDALPRLHKDHKESNKDKKTKYDENTDGEVS